MLFHEAHLPWSITTEGWGLLGPLHFLTHLVTHPQLRKGAKLSSGPCSGGTTSPDQTFGDLLPPHPLPA